ncbi:hypothetical protein BCR35DRAFT_18715 [Leucosporidium creatinivorum]|uniref:Uncharacterized protein n=1 Tax=Leucosporidium creatinivorum TaxID=106004 RepID=A0A1Y2D0N6_9BASI|nr:hypothetical protein BCR35DRAFT_18715 [Leucosporidium creatinivorum]
MRSLNDFLYPPFRTGISPFVSERTLTFFPPSLLPFPPSSAVISLPSTFPLNLQQLDSLSLALSHRLPTTLPRPSVPSWALPSSSPSDITTSGPEEDSAEHKEGVAYWLGVKETLDREAEERVVERRKRWEEVRRAREGRVV